MFGLVERVRRRTVTPKREVPARLEPHACVFDGERDTLGLFDLTGHPFEGVRARGASRSSAGASRTITEQTVRRPSKNEEGFQFPRQAGDDRGHGGSISASAGRVGCPTMDDPQRPDRKHRVRGRLWQQYRHAGREGRSWWWRVAALRRVHRRLAAHCEARLRHRSAREQYARPAGTALAGEGRPQLHQDAGADSEAVRGGRCAVAVRYQSSAARTGAWCSRRNGRSGRRASSPSTSAIVRQRWLEPDLRAGGKRLVFRSWMPLSRLIVLIAGNFFVATSFLSVGGLLNDISPIRSGFRSRKPGCSSLPSVSRPRSARPRLRRWARVSIGACS